VIDVLRELGVRVQDAGAHSEESVDYPDFAALVGEAVAGGQADRGVLVCGTGIGMSIAANKISGVRAALVRDVADAKLSRQHNDANVLVIGGDRSDARAIRDIVRAWWDAEFEGGRHGRRISKIAGMESRPDKKK
jgi:RpiB/LacA/LacB family sugar-phosphate isomerase